MTRFKPLLALLALVLAPTAFGQWTPPITAPPAIGPPAGGEPKGGEWDDLDEWMFGEALKVLCEYYPTICDEIKASVPPNSYKINGVLGGGNGRIKITTCRKKSLGEQFIMTRAGEFFYNRSTIVVYPRFISPTSFAATLYHEWLHVRAHHNHPNAVPGNHEDPCIHGSIHQLELEMLCSIYNAAVAANNGVSPPPESAWDKKLRGTAYNAIKAWEKYCLLCWLKNQGGPSPIGTVQIPNPAACNGANACSCCAVFAAYPPPN